MLYIKYKVESNSPMKHERKWTVNRQTVPFRTIASALQAQGRVIAPGTKSGLITTLADPWRGSQSVAKWIDRLGLPGGLNLVLTLYMTDGFFVNIRKVDDLCCPRFYSRYSPIRTLFMFYCRSWYFCLWINNTREQQTAGVELNKFRFSGYPATVLFLLPAVHLLY